MNRRLVLVILAALVLVLIVAVGISVAANVDFNTTKHLSAYTTGHANARNTNRSTCEQTLCHQTKSSGQDVHARHKRTMFLKFKDSTGTAAYNGCGLCHGGFTTTATAEGVKVGYEGDLSYANTSTVGKIRKQVSAEVCRRCHGGFTATSSPTHQTKAVSISDPDGMDYNGSSGCLACHKQDGTGSANSAAQSHNSANAGDGAKWINTTILDSTSVWQFCTLCHGQDGTTPGISNRVWYQLEETNATATTVGP